MLARHLLRQRQAKAGTVRSTADQGQEHLLGQFRRDAVAVVDTATGVVGATIAVGDGPEFVAVAPDGKRAYVTNGWDGTVSVIDTATRKLVGAPISVGRSPFGLAVSPNSGRVYVANSADDTVSVINATTRKVVGSPVAVGDHPSAVAFTPDGRRALSAGYDETIKVWDLETGAEIPAP